MPATHVSAVTSESRAVPRVTSGAYTQGGRGSRRDPAAEPSGCLLTTQRSRPITTPVVASPSWVAWWRNGSASDFRPRGRGFNPQSGRSCVTTLGKLLEHTCLDADSLRYYTESLNRVPLPLLLHPHHTAYLGNEMCVIGKVHGNEQLSYAVNVITLTTRRSHSSTPVHRSDDDHRNCATAAGV